MTLHSDEVKLRYKFKPLNNETHQQERKQASSNKHETKRIRKKRRIRLTTENESNSQLVKSNNQPQVSSLCYNHRYSEKKVLLSIIGTKPGKQETSK